jgi:hypothetical protein
MEEEPNNTTQSIFREKRKWQIALRRYILEQQKVSFYAPYFGLDISNFRNWIELQFDQDLNWENFGKAWQLDHIVPVLYFDFKVEQDLKLCWNFINIRVEKSHLHRNGGNRVDVLTAKAYFEDIFRSTRLPQCDAMIKKIEQIEVTQKNSNDKLEAYIADKYDYLIALSDFSSYEFEQLNMGVGLEEINLERKLLSKFN